MMERNFYIITYGCQMNHYDAGVVKEILEKEGFQPTANENEARIILLLTCSVREHAEMRALGRLLSLKRKNNGERIVGILGCMAQNYQKRLIDEYGVDLVVGPDGYRHLPRLLRDAEKGIRNVACGIARERACYEGILVKPEQGAVRGFVSIMRGCSNFCSYCIVPYVRGPERSRDYKDIIKEIEILADAGVKDITLVGQNVLAYNSHGLDFCSLLKELEKIPNVYWIRFVTAHPKDFSEPVISALAKLKKFCPCIHLPLQSGSNRILQLMNRRYTAEEYLKKIERTRELIPEVSFTTDLMVGFPTETDEDFLKTLAMAERIRFDFAYMFQYSPRPNTLALKIKPEVNPKVAHNRLERLIAVQSRITKENTQRLIGKELQVLVECLRHNAGQSCAVARTKINKIVVFYPPKADSLSKGEIIEAKIIGVRGWTLIGEPSRDSCR